MGLFSKKRAGANGGSPRSQKKKGWFSSRKKVKLTEAASGSVDKDDHLYRRLTGRAANDKLSALTRDQMIKMVENLYTYNPIGKRLPGIMADFVIGGGVTFAAEEEDVQAVLKEFWDDPVNDMELELPKMVKELGLYGEQCYPAFVNPYTGKVRLGNLIPSMIHSVATDAENAKQFDIIYQKPVEVSDEPKPYKVIRFNEDYDADTYNRLTGDCFYFGVNGLTGKRGVSDLLPIADLIDGYEQFVFNEAERATMLSSFIWDVTLTGMDQEGIDAWLKDQPTPKPGSIRAHNENAKWEAVSPNLNAADVAKLAQLIRNLILGALGFPPHWFADPMDVNKATAQSMSEPTLKMLQERQRYISRMLSYIFRYVIDQAIIAGTLPEDIDTSFQIHMPDLSKVDTETVSSALDNLSNFTSSMIAEGVISVETSRQIVAVVVSMLGVDIDLEKEKGKIAEEKNLDGYSGMRKKPPGGKRGFSEEELKVMTKDETGKLKKEIKLRAKGEGVD